MPLLDAVAAVVVPADDIAEDSVEVWYENVHPTLYSVDYGRLFH